MLSCSSGEKFPVIKTVKKVDLVKYSGRWFEIARFDHSFEKGLVCVTADYTLRPDGRINVVNAGRKENDRDRIKTASAVAWLPDPKDEGKLKVRFFWPFTGDYWIISLDGKNYEYALIGTNSREYLWILSRKTDIDNATYARLVKYAKELGFETEKLYRVPQDCKN
jgi:lipocalin